MVARHLHVQSPYALFSLAQDRRFFHKGGKLNIIGGGGVSPPLRGSGGMPPIGNFGILGTLRLILV